MAGHEEAPTFSPDGEQIYWLQVEPDVGHALEAPIRLLLQAALDSAGRTPSALTLPDRNEVDPP